MSCKYCSEDVDGDNKIRHLHENHSRSEVSGIDAKKVDNQFGGFKDEKESLLSDDRILLAGGAVVFVVFLAAVAYLTLSPGAGTDKFSWVEKEPYGNNHYHGEWYMTVEGQQIDFSQGQYQLQDNAFHFEAGVGVQWHGHAERITIQYALATLGMKAHQESLEYQGTNYTEDQYNIEYLVDGEPVDISEYTLQEGDTVRITVSEK